MSDVAVAKSRSSRHADFWRAVRFLAPHRWTVAISILCALVVGVAFTSSIGTMLPILNVLISGETIQDWVDREVVQKRVGVVLSEDPGGWRVVRVRDDSPARRADVKPGAILIQRDELAKWADPAGGAVLPGGVAPDPAPWYLQWLRNIVGRLPRDPIKAVACILGAIVVLTIVGSTFRFFQEYLSDRAAILTVNDIRRKLYDHILHIPLGFFGLKGTSDVSSRLVQDSQGLQDGLKSIIGPTIQEPIKAGIAFGAACYIAPKLVLFLVCFLPLAAWVIKKFGKKMRRASRKALQESASMLGQIEGSLIGIRVVKAAGAERYERRRYGRIMGDLVGEQLKMSRIDAFNQPTMETMFVFVMAAVVLYATHQVVVTSALKPGSFMIVMGMLVGMGESLRRLSKLNNILQKSNAAAARIFETLDVPVERPRHLDTAADRARINLPPIQKDIRFENITFSYQAATAPALSGVSLTVQRGQCVAVVGRNGSGKTTLLALLPRFYEPQAGRVLIDGMDVRKVTLRSLRKQIGIVTQDSVIFPGSIAQNIAYANPLARRDAIIAAAQQAFAHDFILEKPNGYDTVVGEHGAQLSGGQKQRICIARAILRQTPILILDEATSQVDAESEHLIQQAIESLMHERTTFVIAHRFSTILSADTIVVMERGQIVGIGCHDQLLSTCPIYQQLYERQLVGAAAG